MRIYLAARYSRRVELCGYRAQLADLGHVVQARWLDGGHQISDVGVPIGEHGEALVEHGGEEAAILRAKFARDDFEDVTYAEMVVSFTEPPRSAPNRGGRHVEFGIALARNIRSVVIGYRENIFHWLPQVEFHATWEEFLAPIRARRDAIDMLDGVNCSNPKCSGIWRGRRGGYVSPIHIENTTQPLCDRCFMIQPGRP